jgi:hypothetical protein
MTVTHSKGSTASLQLVPVKDADVQALESTEQEDPIITRRKRIIADKLGSTEVL